MLKVAELISYGLGIYLILGLVFAIYFVTKGVRNEPIEGKAPFLRLMLMPAAILIWPLLLARKS